MRVPYIRGLNVTEVGEGPQCRQTSSQRDTLNVTVVITRLPGEPRESPAPCTLGECGKLALGHRQVPPQHLREKATSSPSGAAPRPLRLPGARPSRAHEAP